MSHFAVVVACGPGEREVERVSDVLRSIFHYEPGTRWAAVIDSADSDRNLANYFPKPPGTTLVSIRNPKPGKGGGQWGGLCVGVLAAYAWVARETDARFVVKFDSDALAIAPFAAQIDRGLRDNPHAAVFGSYLRDCNGYMRNYSGMAGLMIRLHRMMLLEYEPKRFGRRFPLALWGRPAGMRRHIGAAVRNGYIFGEHVSGGANAASWELLDRMNRRGYLDERNVWADTQMSEDVMMGMYAHAVGLGLAGHAADGDAFGVKHVGLPDTPQQLVDRGYSVIHSVKNDARASEEAIRAFFRQRREGVERPPLALPAPTEMPSYAPRATTQATVNDATRRF